LPHFPFRFTGLVGLGVFFAICIPLVNLLRNFLPPFALDSPFDLRFVCGLVAFKSTLQILPTQVPFFSFSLHPWCYWQKERVPSCRSSTALLSASCLRRPPIPFLKKGFGVLLVPYLQGFGAFCCSSFPYPRRNFTRNNLVTGDPPLGWRPFDPLAWTGPDLLLHAPPRTLLCD